MTFKEHIDSLKTAESLIIELEYQNSIDGDRTTEIGYIIKRLKEIVITPIHSKGGFVRCYTVECDYNSAKVNAQHGFNPQYGICVRQANGDKITVSGNGVCGSRQITRNIPKPKEEPLLRVTCMNCNKIYDYNEHEIICPYCGFDHSEP